MTLEEAINYLSNKYVILSLQYDKEYKTIEAIKVLLEYYKEENKNGRKKES